ncbi:MAG TPA: beta-ketoacyl synthase N-terminal-like domain-containing protein [Thermodesulfovibrionales bacterium]|nr:beta-ketoacyl synthase N-terminal-like domain-containing protein [Thermodesulfovibrionales bacterium]
MSSKREVVITGTGLVTPLGIGVEKNWKNVQAMKSGITGISDDTVPRFMQYKGSIPAIEIDRDVPSSLQRQLKFLNRGSRLGFAAVREAFFQAGADLSDVEPARRGLHIASGDLTTVDCVFMHEALRDATKGAWKEIGQETLNQSTLYKVNPYFLLESIMNNSFTSVSAFLECMGSNTSLASHAPCGAHAFELAFRSIADGQADVAFAVGCGNWITEIPLFEMNSLGMLSSCRLDVHSYRPFDAARDGFIAGEGGAALFLESAERAEQRGARILGKVMGFGNSIALCDDEGLGIPPEVSAGSMKLALEEAGSDLGDYAFVCGHGLASEEGDRSELRSVMKVFGGKRDDIPLCGLKPYTGHLGAASDIGEIILGMESVRGGIVPATLNFVEAEREYSDLRISGSHQPCQGSCFMTVSYGIGGQSCVAVVQVP